MLVQLKCKACDAILKQESDSKLFFCESCGSKYIYVDDNEEDIIDLNGFLKAKQEEKNSFMKKMKKYAERDDSEVVEVNELYNMAYAEYRLLNGNERIEDILNSNDWNDSLESYKIIACPAENKSPEYYLPTIQEACRIAHTNLIILIPEPKANKKNNFIEKMFEYHMSNEASIVLAFCKNKKTIGRAYHYCDVHGDGSYPETPVVILGPKTAYIQGNQIILFGGDVEAADEYDNNFETIAEENRAKQEKLEAEKIKVAKGDQSSEWMKASKCRYCGGTFSGFWIFKKCSNCGKTKDYSYNAEEQGLPRGLASRVLKVGHIEDSGYDIYIDTHDTYDDPHFHIVKIRSDKKMEGASFKIREAEFFQSHDSHLDYNMLKTGLPHGYTELISKNDLESVDRYFKESEQSGGPNERWQTVIKGWLEFSKCRSLDKLSLKQKRPKYSKLTHEWNIE